MMVPTAQLSTVSLVVLAACYEPEAVDCTVACGGVDECAAEQICGSDGFCARRERAGACAGSGATLVTLRVEIEGKGKVTIAGVGLCDSGTAADHACMFAVPARVGRQLFAVESYGRDFKRWTSGCVGDGTSCALTPVSDVTEVGARFE